MTVPPQPSTSTFDYKNHREKSVAKYIEVQALYEEFALVVRNILKDVVTRQDIRINSIDWRAKSRESFAEKAVRPSEEDPNTPKYKNPLVEITDLAGVRVITFFPRTVKELDALIAEQFQIEERVDHTAFLEQEERFGYKSVHYLVKLSAERLRLPEYAKFSGLIAEIQVRTVLQHSWAEIEHDIQYKSSITIPPAIRRRFMSLAGLLEIADREFQAIQDSDESLRKDARQSVEKGDLKDVGITPDALRTYLDNKLGPDYRMSPFSYEWTAKLLLQMGFTDIQQVDDCIKNYSDGTISPILYKTRQGQLTRFEDLLLAGMGERFQKNHSFSKYPWFKERIQNRLAQLRAAGVPIGTFAPDSSAQK